MCDRISPVYSAFDFARDVFPRYFKASRQLTPDSFPNSNERTSKAAASRLRVLDAAAKLFNDVGYAATTMRDVAEIAQMKAGSLYYHFSSKESLLDAVLERSITELTNKVSPYLDPESNDVCYRDRIATAMRVHLSATLELGNYAAASRRLLREVPPDLRARHEEARRSLGRKWKKLLEAAQAAGEIRSDFNLSLARLFMIGALNYANQWYNPDRGSLDDVAEALITMMFTGLGIAQAGEKKIRRIA